MKSIQEALASAAEDPLVPIDPPFENTAGSIWNLANGGFESASFIESRTGSIRSNHYHKEDSHLIFVIHGLVIYYWRQAGSNEPLKRLLVPTGKMVATGPLVEHATYFLEHTMIVTLNGRSRDHQSHEADLVRVPPLISADGCTTGHCALRKELTPRTPEHPAHDGPHMDVFGREFTWPR